MAKRIKRPKKQDVAKFGGVEELGEFKEAGVTQFHSELSGRDTAYSDVPWDAKGVEASSDTKLEMDEGYGQQMTIRCFEFATNPSAFKEHTPTAQELFNYHIKGIEMHLWADGWKISTDVSPRLVFEGTSYKIFVPAVPQKGQRLLEDPKTLSELVHGRLS